MRTILTLRSSFLLLTCSLLASAEAKDWPQFRGPDGQGRSSFENLPTIWDPSTNVVWKHELPGHGWSSPVAADGRIYLTAAVPIGDEKVSSEGRFTKKVASPYSLRAICLSYESGEIIWNVEVSSVPAETSIHPKNSHASSTPIVTRDRVYVHFGAHGTAALDLDGKIVWKKKIEYPPVHGSGGSPVLFEDLLIMNCDGAEAPFVIALVAATGEERWRTARPEYKRQTFSFSTPLIIEVDGQPQLVSVGSHAVCGYEPRSGKQKWVVHFPSKWSVVPRPVFAGGLVLICTGYEGPAELLAIRPDGEGDVSESHVAWREGRFIPHNPSPLVDGDSIYLVSDDGIASCRDLKSGKLNWKKRLGGAYSASPIIAGDRIFYLSEEGVCTVVKAAEKFEELAKNEIEERTFASLAALDGSLLIRTESQLYRIGKNDDAQQ